MKHQPNRSTVLLLEYWKNTKINKEKEPQIEEIKEKPIQTSHDQSNESGCSIQ